MMHVDNVVEEDELHVEGQEDTNLAAEEEDDSLLFEFD